MVGLLLGILFPETTCNRELKTMKEKLFMKNNKIDTVLDEFELDEKMKTKRVPKYSEPLKKLVNHFNWRE